MSEIFFLKVITESNKRFIIKADPESTINSLIDLIKRYFAHYYSLKYFIKYIYTPDKFAILDNMPIKYFFNTGDICYIKGNEQDGKLGFLEGLVTKISYDQIQNINKSVAVMKEGPTILSSQKTVKPLNAKNFCGENERLTNETNVLENKQENKIDSPNKKKNKKDARNYNIKNGINPNLIINDTNKHKIYSKGEFATKKISNVIESPLSKPIEVSNDTDNKINLTEENKQDPDLKEKNMLFILENINDKPKEKPVIEIKGIKQVKKKKKINYDEL